MKNEIKRPHVQPAGGSMPERSVPHKKPHRVGRSGSLLSSMLVMLGLFGAGFFPGYYYYQGKVNANFVTVKGLSETDVKADLAVWEMRFVSTGDDLSLVQKDMKNQLATIKKFLSQNGLDDAEIEEGRIDTNDLTTNPYLDKMKSRYILTQTVTLRSKDVDAVDMAVSKSGDLISNGVTFDSQQYSSPVSYIFTGLNGIKAKMLEEATANAKVAAEEFAKNSDSKVGKIKYANQGVFSILPRVQTASSSENQQINKTVRVVVTVDYWLK